TMRKALGLLAEAGWKLNGQRLQNSIGQPLRFEILLVNPNLERILQPYVENLASNHVSVHHRTEIHADDPDIGNALNTD
ncbi:hypothetical protein AB4142_38335, partial [Variovorax sp. 2RAF20]